MAAISFKEPNVQALLERIAQDEGFKVPKFCTESCTKPGENFVCRIFRVLITEKESKCKQDKLLSLIFKVSLTNANQQYKLSSDIRFQLESDMYQIILPTLNTLLVKHGLTNHSTFPGTARCYGVELNNISNGIISDAIVLEDLKPQGYGIIDMKTGLEENHCRLVLEKLALFHSSSIALGILDPDTNDRFKNMLKSTPWRDDISEELLHDFQKAAFSAIELLEEPFKKGNPIYDRLQKLCENFREEFRKLNDTPHDITCITHGDCWSNNLLFKFADDGKPQDVRIVDFQTPGYTSPVIDVVLVLIECTTKDTRSQHHDLLKYYYDETAKDLMLLGCDPEKVFPWKLFQEHLKFYGKIGVLWSLIGLPVHMAEKSDDTVDVDKDLFSDTREVRTSESLFKLRQWLTGIVSDAAQWGYI